MKRAAGLGGKLARARNRVYHRFFKFPHHRRRHYESVCRSFHPVTHHARAGLAKSLLEEHGDAGTAGRLVDDGFLEWSGTRHHPLADAVVEAARSVLDAGARQSMQARSRELQQNLVVQRLDGELEKRSPFLRFALDPRVLATAAAYLGVLPMLDGIYLWYSPNERSSTDRNSSQLFHIDPTGYRELKLFVHVTDVTHDTGPLTLVRAAASRKLYPLFAHHTGSIADAEVQRIVGRDAIVALTGPAGTVTGADTSTCFHYGSRQGTRRRVLVHFHYMSPYVPRFPLLGRLRNDRYAYLVDEESSALERHVLGCG